MDDRMYGPRFAEALAFSCARHQGQRRKGNGAPYVTHPLAVASYVGEYGGDEDQAIAGLLHDVMEDCGVTAGELQERFGERVARIVVACTDTTEHPKPPWRARKEQHLANVKLKPAEVKLVLACDKLHNASAILRDLGRDGVGHEVWSRFKAPRDEVLWYYQAMIEALAHDWQHDVLEELTRVIAALERG